MKEKIQFDFLLKSLITTGILTGLVFCSFSSDTKEDAIRLRGPFCQRCRKKTRNLKPHHNLPESMGGNNSIGNLFLPCPDCHSAVDDEAQENGILTDGIFVENVGSIHPELIKDWGKYQSASDKFKAKFGKRI